MSPLVPSNSREMGTSGGMRGKKPGICIVFYFTYQLLRQASPEHAYLGVRVRKLDILTIKPYEVSASLFLPRHDRHGGL